MALDKLRIAVEEKYPNFGKPTEVLFNPQQIEIVKEGWSTDKKGQLIPSQQPLSLTLDLFFDTTLSGFPPEDVRNYTKLLYNITNKKSNLSRPPMCRLIWGAGDVLLLQGVLKSITKNLTHFFEDGTPIRATLNCSFEEWLPSEFKEKKENPIDDPIRIVRKGETLSSIAAEEYNDPSLWRIIAKENRINNPRTIVAGQRLTVPPLRV